jgi:ATP diphosphatase
MSDAASKLFQDALDLMAQLRGPAGCPWDREQTFDSIKRHTLEETYEVFDAIDRAAWPELRDELGDLLLQVLFYAQMAREAGYFSMEDVIESLNAKLVRRHPHIFGDANAVTSQEVNQQWERIKRQEKMIPDGEVPGLLDDIGRYLPAMVEAYKLGGRAARVGFDWPSALPLVAKLHEETDELQAELESGSVEAACNELGDVLFTAVNLSRHLGVDAEFVLRATNRKFRQRFTSMEAAAGADGLKGCTAERLEALWSEAKQRERRS